MVAIGPYGTAALPSAIESAGGTAVQRIEASAQLVAGISFDDEVDVIGLDGEVHDAEGVAGGERRTREPTAGKLVLIAVTADRESRAV